MRTKMIATKTQGTGGNMALCSQKRTFDVLTLDHYESIDRPVDVESARSLVRALRAAAAFFQLCDGSCDMFERVQEMEEEKFSELFGIDYPNDKDAWNALSDVISMKEGTRKERKVSETSDLDEKNKIAEPTDASQKDADPTDKIDKTDETDETNEANEASTSAERTDVDDKSMSCGRTSPANDTSSNMEGPTST